MLYLLISFLPLIWFIVKVSVRLLDKWEAKRCSFGDKKAYVLLMSSRRDHLALKSAFSQLKKHDERYFYSLCASRFVTLDLMRKWVKSDPESRDAYLCLGAKLIQSAWDARGYGRGNEISEKSWEKYSEYLDEAGVALSKCIELDDNDATPWAYLLVVATGLSFDRDDKDYYFENAVARDPENWAAHMHMIIAISEKWGGCNREMVKFAKEASNKAPKGSDLSLLFVKAYLEEYKYLELFQQNESGALIYKGSEAIANEISDAYDQSDIAKNIESKKTSIFVRYNVSSWFCLTSDFSRLKNELGNMRGRIQDIHWRWAGAEGMLKPMKKKLGFSN